MQQSSTPVFEKIKDKNTLSILTPGLQKRKIAKLKLANGLGVYLISDAGVDKSAAGLAMQVGSWQDPKEYAGMAHFCEHLLFMSTKTYPGENFFKTCVSDNQGIYNAYTGCDRTVYMFAVNHGAFANILDQFAHFFIDPAFNPSSVARELHAVDQENDMYHEDDA
jgi:insulysin